MSDLLFVLTKWTGLSALHHSAQIINYDNNNNAVAVAFAAGASAGAGLKWY